MKKLFNYILGENENSDDRREIEKCHEILNSINIGRRDRPLSYRVQTLANRVTNATKTLQGTYFIFDIPGDEDERKK